MQFPSFDRAIGMAIRARADNARALYDSMTADSGRSAGWPANPGGRQTAARQVRVTSSAGGLEKKDSQPSSVTWMVSDMPTRYVSATP